MTTAKEHIEDPAVDSTWAAIVELSYDRRARQLWEYARRLGLDSASAEDAAQEVFARALHLVRVRRPNNLDPWLFASLHNYAIDRHRHAKRARLRELAEPDLGPDDAGRLGLWQEIDRLPLRQRQAVYLRYRADLDYPAIASVLGISESGARANVFRAMSQLRERMEER